MSPTAVDENAAVVAYVTQIYSQNPSGILGSWLMGLLIQTGFLGVLFCQTVSYAYAFPNDAKWLKSLVGAVVGLSCLEWVISMTTAWSWFVIDFGNWVAVVQYPWHLCAQPVVFQLCISSAQLYFVHRCYLLTGRNKFVIAILGSAMLTSIGLFTALSILWAHDPYNQRLNRMITAPGLILDMCTDATIAALSTYCITASVSRGFNMNTDAVIDKLVALIWEAAIPPVIGAVINFVFWWSQGSENIIWTVFSLLTVRLYAFALLHTLNSRNAIRQTLESGSSNQGGASYRLNPLDPPRRDPKRATSNITFAPQGIRVTTQSYSTWDIMTDPGEDTKSIHEMEFAASEDKDGDTQLNVYGFGAASGIEVIHCTFLRRYKGALGLASAPSTQWPKPHCPLRRISPFLGSSARSTTAPSRIGYPLWSIYSATLTFKTLHLCAEGLVLELRVNSDDDDYNWLRGYLDDSKVWDNMATFTVSTDSKTGVHGSFTVPNDVAFCFRFKGTLCHVTSSAPPNGYKHLIVKFFTRKHQVVKDLTAAGHEHHFAKLTKSAEESKRTSTKYAPDPSYHSRWTTNYDTIEKHPSATIAPDGLKQAIVEDIKTFVAAKDQYAAMGLPHCRRYLIYGPPGAGKMTAIYAVAVELGKNIYRWSSVLARGLLGSVGARCYRGHEQPEVPGLTPEAVPQALKSYKVCHDCERDHAMKIDTWLNVGSEKAMEKVLKGAWGGGDTRDWAWRR